MPESSGLSKRKEALLHGLARKSVRERRGRFVAEGIRVVEEALSSRWRVTDIVATASAARDIERWRAAGKLAGVEVSTTDARTFKRLTESVHPQGALAVVEEPETALPEERPDSPVLLLDRLQDPGNTGALLRSLHATGGRIVIALSGTVDLFNAKVVRASAGSLFHLVPVGPLSLEGALEWLESRAVPLLALDRRGKPLFTDLASVPAAFALAVGNEGAGLAPELLSRAERTLALPMARGVDSLNAGVAGSVALYELWRRRLPSTTERGARRFDRAPQEPSSK